MLHLLPKIQARVARLAWRFILGPVAGKIPRNFVFSIQERQHDPQVISHLVERSPISPQETVSWQFPDHYPPWLRRHFVFAPFDAFLMRDVVVGPTSGAVWTPEGLVFGESIGSLNKALTFGKVLPDLCSKSIRLNHLNGDDRVVFIPAPPVSYFHWVCEVLPNLLRLVSLHPHARLVTAPDRPRYVDESIRVVFGRDFCSQQVTVARRPLRVPQAAFATMPAASGFVRPEDALLVRKTVLSQVITAENKKTGRKIFISRRGTKARAIADQNHLEQSFSQDGYELVQLEKLPWADQVRLFANAESIAGLHGAGFANILFAPSHCSIHEIFPEGYCNDCYARLAESLGMVYRYSLVNDQ